jgi:hypothetical protein
MWRKKKGKTAKKIEPGKIMSVILVWKNQKEEGEGEKDCGGKKVWRLEVGRANTMGRDGREGRVPNGLLNFRKNLLLSPKAFGGRTGGF